MKIGLSYKIWLCFLISAFALAQEQKGYYMPYQMPTHAFVRFNTFVANPAFPLIVNYQEHNVGLYYRNQWSGYKNDNFSLMGLSYGRNWRETSSMNAMVFKRNATVMTNYGVVLNYGHLITLSSFKGCSHLFTFSPFHFFTFKGREASFHPLTFSLFHL